MKSFKSFIHQESNEMVLERFVNLFEKDIEERKKYAEEVWNILQTTYAKIGGIKGNGFNNVDDMIQNIPFWKLVRKNGKIVTVVMYKTKDGRKLVACGTDGSNEGKEGLLAILMNDMQDPINKSTSRAFFEVSDKLLFFIVNRLGYDFVKKFVVELPEVKRIMSRDEILPILSDDIEAKNHPLLAKYFYRRDIGGHLHTKIMIGVDGKYLY